MFGLVILLTLSGSHIPLPASQGGVAYCESMVSYLRSQFSSPEDLLDLIDQKEKLMLQAQTELVAFHIESVGNPAVEDADVDLALYAERELYEFYKEKDVFTQYAASIEQGLEFCHLLKAVYIDESSMVYPDQGWLLDVPQYEDRASTDVN